LYEVLEVKGAGGFGMVVSVRHKGNNLKMALKVAPVTAGNSSGSETLKTEMGVLQKL
jgi:serine/threonine protein kinase